MALFRQTPSAAAETAAPRFYIPELDTLRFFAFFGVFWFHISDLDLLRRTFLAQWPMGFARIAAQTGILGVDLFFTLSAYLITALLLKEGDASGRVDVKSYYIRRILRIWPLYYFFIAAAFVLSYFGGPFSVGTAYIVSLLLFFGNYGIVQAFANPARWHANLVAGPLWTVSAEEQFYLLWPLAIRNGSRRTAMGWAIALLAAAFLDRLRAGWFDYFGPQVPVVTVFTHLDSFAVGILIAAVPFFAKTQKWGLLARAGLVIAGLAAWAGAVAYGNYPSASVAPLRVMITYPAVAVGSGCLLLAAVGAGKAGARFMLNTRLRYLGKISYGLYVYHGLAVTLAQLSVSRIELNWLAPLGLPFRFGQALYIAAALSLTILVSAASYRWLESPFLRLKDRFTHVPSRPV